MAGLPPYPGTPRWVKVSGTIAIVLAIAFVILHISGVIGRHGPGRHGGHGDRAPEGHNPPGAHGGHTPHGDGR